MSRHVFDTMGTVASLTLPGFEAPEEMLNRVKNVFRDMDDLYSLYKPTSTLSRINTGMLNLAQAGADVRDMYATAMRWRTDTGGNFTPNMPTGGIDLSGVVKAKAIKVAGEICDAYPGDWLLNVGGDVLARGEYDGNAWTCGIVDPDDTHAILTTVDLLPDARAIATSGTAERGEHVWRNDLDSTLRQVSVITDDIVVADVIATAVLSGGVDYLFEAAARWDARIIAVTQENTLVEVMPARFAAAAA